VRIVSSDETDGELGLLCSCTSLATGEILTVQVSFCVLLERQGIENSRSASGITFAVLSECRVGAPK
jgi:hypothetical protein